MELTPFSWKKYLQYGFIAFIALFIYQWVSNPLVITVVGTSSVTAPAESAVLTFTLSSQSGSPQESLSSVKNNVTKLKEVLKEMGVPESDIYESQAVVVPASTITAGESGFQSTISMGLKTTNVGSLDRMISTLYAQGALVVSQPILTVKDSAEIDKKAYNEALKDAKRKAGEIAMSNLKFFRKIVLIQESQGQGISTVTTTPEVTEQVEDNLSPADGLIKINKTVSVSYKLW